MTEREIINTKISRRRLLQTAGFLGTSALLNACTPKESIPEQSTHLPTVTAESSTPAMEHQPQPTPLESLTEKRDIAPREWLYDFSKLKDGPLPSEDWNFEDGVEASNYNGEAQAYTPRPKNVRIENGTLVIEAHAEKFLDKDYTSARINTLEKFEFTHGVIEVNMKTPRGVGTWPAAWLMPAHNIYNPDDFGISKDDTFRWAMNGEIDFAESIGAIPNENIPAAHSYNQFKRGTIYTPGYLDTPYDEFHTYGLIKESNKLTFTLDGAPYATREKLSDDPRDWPYEQPYYLILNLAIGGPWAGSKGIDTASAPWQMQVKSISYRGL